MPSPNRDALLTANLGGVVGVIAFASSLGFPLVDPSQTDWLATRDWRVHFLGWHTYRATPWQIPPGANPYFGHPVGASVALTDSIPIFALLFKLLDPWLPTRFQYIGLWLLVSHVLQGAFGALLVRCVTPHRTLQIIGAALLVMAPVLLYRAGHPALSAHWLLLAALWLHFRSADARAALSRGALVRSTVVISVVAATHPYLGFMVLAIFTAHMAAVALRVDLRQYPRIAGVLLTSAMGYTVVSWLCGYFVVRSTGDLVRESFGEFSMNVLAPIAPLEHSMVLGPLVFPKVVQTAEGYSYLGIGLIALAVPAAVGWLRRPTENPERSPLPVWPLLVVMLVLTAMALGPVVRAGDAVTFQYSEELWGPLRLFRANGRMFWPALSLLAGDHGVSVNAAMAARYDGEKLRQYCDELPGLPR